MKTKISFKIKRTAANRKARLSIVREIKKYTTTAMISTFITGAIPGADYLLSISVSILIWAASRWIILWLESEDE